MTELKLYNPTTPSLRHIKRVRLVQSELNNKEVKSSVKKSLRTQVKYSAGRNNAGRVTSRGKGGRVKRDYRVIDFARGRLDIPGEVMAIEYDPNRSAFIAIVKYSNGQFCYILAPNGLKVGQKVISSEKLGSLEPGNAYPLKIIPAATFVHNVELAPNKGGILARAAGAKVQIQGTTESGYVQLKMPSGEIRLVNQNCYATIGTVSNLNHLNEAVGKAGTSRRSGIKPIVRGVAQSYKHPHGGGQGKSGRHGTGGPAQDLWGNKRGVITRRRKHTNKYIISRRTSTLRPTNKPYKTIA